jgi:cyanophycin synthetase
MLVERITVLRGPNYWSAKHHNLIVLTIDLQDFENVATHLIPGFPGRLAAAFPALAKVPASEGADRHLLNAVAEGTHWAPVILHTAVMLQQEAGMTCTYTQAQAGERSGQHHLVFAYGDEEAGRYAAEAAVRLVAELIKADADPSADIRELRAICSSNALGPSTGSLYAEAVRRGIPTMRLDGGSLIQLGYGAAQKRFETTITSATSSIAVDIAGNKHATKNLLKAAYLPVPHGDVIQDVNNLPPVLDSIGFPVVIKPLDGNQGKGATIGIANTEEALAAFARAKQYSQRVVVERFVEGLDFRALVINRRFVAAARRTPAAVTGDGIHTIAQLVEIVNADPRRGNGHSNVLTKVVLDASSQKLLAKRGYTADTILPKGQEVWLKETANLSTGGTAADVTDDVHPANRSLFERVARTVGLDICGIDIMAPDLSRPLAENGGAIIEVNAAPGFRMHLEPTSGRPRNVAAPVLDMLFPDGEQGRIPIVAVSGTNGKTTTTRLIAQMAQQGGHQTGFTTTDGIYLNHEMIYKGDCSGPASAKVVLRDPAVEFAVLECARGGILRSGLGFDQCNCAVITNVAEDHLGLNGIDTIEKLAKVKAVVAKSVMPGGWAILNADDDLVYAMRGEVDAQVALFSLYPHSARIERHCEAGGLAAVYDDGLIMIRKGNTLIPIEAVENIPLTHNGRARFNVANVLGATLAAYTTRIPLPAIRCTLRRFRNSVADTPGRMNEFVFPQFSVLVDYAHNTHGVRALGEFIATVPASRKIGVITAVGDRRNEDIIALGEEAAKIFDEIIIRYDGDLRGRTEFELGSLLRSGIQKVAPAKKLLFCPDEVQALELALKMTMPDSYVVLLVENIGAVCNRLQELQDQKQATLSEIRMTG